MRPHFTILLVSLACGCCTPSSFGQAADPAALLKSMIEATSLDSADAGSWHWKMDVTVYDFNGKNPVPGSIEVWRSDGNMRTVMTAAAAQQTTLRVGNKLYRSGDDSPNFSRLEAAFMQVLNPIPNEFLDPSLKLKLVGQKAGKTKLNCVEPTLGKPGTAMLDASARLDFCAMDGTDGFVAAYEANDTSIMFGQLGTFRSKQVPMTFRISSSGHLRADGKTTTLSPFSPAPDEFAVTPDLHPLQLPIKNNGDGIGFLMLVREMPLAPAGGANAGHAEGWVKFDILIGQNGRIVSYAVVDSSNDQQFNRASEENLTHMIYRPYLINGIPVQVKASTGMSFSVEGSAPGMGGNNRP
jgi:hypothetical protein